MAEYTHPAAAALGVGTHADAWTVGGMLELIQTQYARLIAEADEAHQRHDLRSRRLLMARALEHATLLALYYQEQGDTPLFLRWDRRTRQCMSIAYRQTNKVSPDLGAIVVTRKPGETLMEDI